MVTGIVIVSSFGITNGIHKDTKLNNVVLTNIETLAESEGYVGVGVTINIDNFSIKSNRCVCKQGYCSDGAWISLRKECGSGDSDSQCSNNGHSTCGR